MKKGDVSEAPKSVTAELESSNEGPAKKLRLSKIGKKGSSKPVQSVKRTKKILVSSDDDVSEKKSTEEVGGYGIVDIKDKEKRCIRKGSSKQECVKGNECVEWSENAFDKFRIGTTIDQERAFQ